MSSQPRNRDNDICDFFRTSITPIRSWVEKSTNNHILLFCRLEQYIMKPVSTQPCDVTTETEFNFMSLILDYDFD